MNIEELSKIFNERERENITCMHFDDEITKQITENLGFNIAKVKVDTKDLDINNSYNRNENVKTYNKEEEC